MSCVCAFLISGNFWTASVWKEWLLNCDENIKGVVLYVSNTSKEDNLLVQQFVADLKLQSNLKIVVCNSNRTEWSMPSIMRAELDLFSECQKMNASHYFLISEKTIPTVSSKRLVEFCASLTYPYLEKSSVDFYVLKESKDSLQVKQFKNKMKSQYNTDFYAGRQFLLLNDSHFSRIKQDAYQILQDCEHDVDWVQEGLPMDEFLLHSLLFSKFGEEGWNYAEILYASFEKGKNRASEQSDTWVQKNLSNVLEKSSQNCFWLGARKVKATEQVLDILRSKNVL